MERSAEDRRPPPTSPAASARPRFFGDYELLEEIARGGMGIVCKARQLSLNRIVAVKMIRAGVLASELDIARFQAEARAAAGLQHPNIIAIHEVGEYDERHYFSMEFVEGRNLATCVRDHPWAAPRAAHCLEIIAKAVHYAHQHGILHRDLKPSNVIIDETGTPHLTDFGLATRIEDASALTLTGVILGTPSYMAPEQTGGRTAEIGPGTDVYALGAILYEVLTGRPPFQGETPLETIKLVRETDPVRPRRLNPNVSADLETICLKCLEKEPGHRFATAQDLAEDLERFSRHEPIRARPITWREHVWKWVRRNPWRTALAAASLAGFLAAVGLGMEWTANLELRRVNGQLRETEKRLQTALEASESAHQRERLQRERAEAAEKESRSALVQVRNARDLASQSDYRRRIVETQQSLDAIRITEAERLLDGCPEELRRWEWHYLKQLTRTERAQFLLSTNGANQIALSADGRRVAIQDGSGRLRTLDLTTGSTVELGDATGLGATALAVASEASWILLGVTNSAGNLCLITPPSARNTFPFDSASSTARGLALAADDHLFVRVAEEGLAVGEAATGSLRWRMPAPRGLVGLGVALDRSASRIAWITAPSQPDWDLAGRPLDYRGSAVQILASLDGSLIREFNADLDDVRAVALNDAGLRLATGHGNGWIRLWNVETGRLEGVLRGHTGAVLDLTFSEDGAQLASGGADLAVRVWSLAVGGESKVFRGHRAEIRRVAFSPGGTQIIAASLDASVRVWDIRSPSHDLQCPGLGYSIGFLDDGRVVLGDGTVHSAADGRNVLTLRSDPRSRINLHRESGWLALGVTLAQSVATGFRKVEWTNTVFNASGGVSCAAIQPEAGVVALPRQSPKDPVELVIRRLADGAVERTLPTGTNLIYDVSFDPQGRYLAVCTGSWRLNGVTGPGAPGELQLWDWRTAQRVRTLSSRRYCIWTAAFTADGEKVITAGGLYMRGSLLPAAGVSHGEIQVWDVATGRELFDLPGVSDNVFGVAINSDGSRLAAAVGKFKTNDGFGEVKLWDLQSGLEILTLRGFSGPVHGVAFSPDGKRLAAVGSGTLRIWSVD